MLETITTDIIPANDAARLEALRNFAILFTPSEEVFDNITQIMSQVFRTPMAFISLVDKEKVFYKSQVGPFGRDHVQREDSLCSLTILSNDPLVIEDASGEACFAYNPYVAAEGGIRFYAGAPLITKEGYQIGTVCLVDTSPRSFSEEEKQMLVRFAKLVMHEIEMRYTALRQIEIGKELHKAQTQLRAALEVGKIAPWHWDVVSNKVYGNDELAKMFGVEKDKVIEGLPLEVFISSMHPDDQQQVFGRIKNALESGEEYEAEYRVFNEKHEEHWVIARGRARYEDGSAVSLTGSLIDITDRKLVEAVLAESQERFRTLANSITQLAWIADASGWIHWYNEQWYAYTGSTLEEMQGWGWKKVHHPDHADRVIQFVTKAWHKDEPWELVFPLRRHDGEYRWFLTRGVPVRNNEGKVVQWIGTNTDIDDQKKAEAILEQRVRERTRELEMRNQEMEQFTYVSHHDLQEPLRKITLFTEMVKTEAVVKLSKEAQLRLEKVSDASRRMSVALKDVLNFAALNKEEQFSDVNLGEVVSTVLTDLELLIQEKNATVRISPLPVISATPQQMQQLFYNLVNNALKFARQDIEPLLTISHYKLTGKEAAALYPELDLRKEYHQIIVQDNGIGFPEQYKEKIFTLFQRLHSRSDYAGTGIGLALVRKVVVNHAGKVWAESKEGQGASFNVLLPAT